MNISSQLYAHIASLSSRGDNVALVLKFILDGAAGSVLSPVKAATTANLDLSGTETVDGVSIVAGDHVLAKDQSDAKENGIWVCQAGAWKRRDDANETRELPPTSLVFVRQGTANGDKAFVLTNNTAPVIGTDNITWGALAQALTAADASIDITSGAVKATGTVVAQRTQIAQGAGVTSANELTLGTDGTVFVVGGATELQKILTTGWQQGSMVFLKFSSTPLVKHEFAANGANKGISLSGAVDFQAAAGDTLALWYNGTHWEEAFRRTYALNTSITQTGGGIGFSGIVGARRLQQTQAANAVAATNITLGTGNFFVSTGATPIVTIVTTGWAAGSQICIQFTEAVTVTHGTGAAALRLKGGVNLVAAANDVLGLVFDGTLWRETFRTIAV